MSRFNNAFRIELTGDWEDQSVHYFLGPEAGGLQHNLSVQVDTQPSSPDLADYAEERIGHAMESHPGSELLNQQSKQLSSGFSAYEAVYKWAPAEDKVVFQKLVFVMHEGVVYNFNAAFTKRTIKTLGVEVDRMIASLVPGSRM